MRIALLNLTGGGVSGGHKKYLLNMLPRLASSPEVDGVLCASPVTMGATEWLPMLANVSYVSCAPFRPLRHVPDAALKSALDIFKPDVIYIPIERYIKYGNVPVVVMLQNMAPLAGVKTGVGFKEKLVAVARRYETRIAIHNSAELIVPTEYVKEFLGAHAGLSLDKITTVHYGNTAVSDSQRCPDSFPLNGENFIFTAGSLESYRGIEDLLRAMSAVKMQFPGIKLVIAGGSRPATEKYLLVLKNMVSKLGLSKDIVWLGNISEEELSWCYSHCSAFAITSRMESFCFVALESLMHGCNIVSSDSACLPEILGDSVLYYKVGDVPALSSALAVILSRSPAERTNYSSASVSKASGFIWDRAATLTLDVLKKAIPAA